MQTGTQRKYVIKPINRLADGCPARRVVERAKKRFADRRFLKNME